jgi:hypothetical protein
MSKPKLNDQLFCRTIKHVEKFPDNFNMGTWGESDVQAATTRKGAICGTTACFGGWAVWLDLEEKLKNPNVVTKAWRAVLHDQRTSDRNPMYDQARKLLGLTKPEAARVFYCSNGDIRKSIKEVYANRGQKCPVS